MGRAVELWRDYEIGPWIYRMLAQAGAVDDYDGDLDGDPEDDLITVDELPDFLGMPDENPDQALGFVGRVAAALGVDEVLPPELERELAIGTLLDEGARRPRIINVPKDDAAWFIRSHHSEFAEYNPKGLLYAIGVEVAGRVVAVATVTTPAGAYKGRPGCPFDGAVELSRIASDGTVKGASSMLAARAIDLLPVSGRRGAPGCLLSTYSLLTERGTTYLALIDKGLRPTHRTRPSAPSGVRRGTRIVHQADAKIGWEAGPAARPADWSVLAGVADAKQLAGAKKNYDAREARLAAAAARAARRPALPPRG